MTREEKKRRELETLKAECAVLLARTDELFELLSKSQPSAPQSEVKAFEVDGERIPYEQPKSEKVDSSISSAWLAIAKANK